MLFSEEFVALSRKIVYNREQRAFIPGGAVMQRISKENYYLDIAQTVLELSLIHI